MAPGRLAPGRCRAAFFVRKLPEASFNRSGGMWRAGAVHAEHGFATTAPLFAGGAF